jgi:hypothetical protein
MSEQTPIIVIGGAVYMGSHTCIALLCTPNWAGQRSDLHRELILVA